MTPGLSTRSVDSDHAVQVPQPHPKTRSGWCMQCWSATRGVAEKHRWVIQAMLIASITSLFVIIEPINSWLNGSGYWAVVSALLVLEGTTGASLKKSAERISGTIIGGLGGWVLFTLITWDEKYTTEQFASYLLWVVVSLWPLPWGYVRAMAPDNPLVAVYGTMTGHVVMISSFIVGGAFRLALLRIFCVASGVLVTGLVVHFVLPNPARDRLHKGMSEVLNLMADMLEPMVQVESDMQSKVTINALRPPSDTLKDLARARQALIRERLAKLRKRKAELEAQGAAASGHVGALLEDSHESAASQAAQDKKRPSALRLFSARNSLKPNNSEGLLTSGVQLNEGGVNVVLSAIGHRSVPEGPRSTEESQGSAYIRPVAEERVSISISPRRSRRVSYAESAISNGTGNEKIKRTVFRGSGEAGNGSFCSEAGLDNLPYSGYLSAFRDPSYSPGITPSNGETWASLAQSAGSVYVVGRSASRTLPCVPTEASALSRNNTSASVLKTDPSSFLGLVVPEQATKKSEYNLATTRRSASPSGRESEASSTALEIPSTTQAQLGIGSRNKSRMHVPGGLREDIIWSRRPSIVPMSDVSQMSEFQYREEELEKQRNRITLEAAVELKKLLRVEEAKRRERWEIIIGKMDKCQGILTGMESLLSATKNEIVCPRAMKSRAFARRGYGQLISSIKHLFYHVASLYFSLDAQMTRAAQAKQRSVVPFAAAEAYGFFSPAINEFAEQGETPGIVRDGHLNEKIYAGIIVGLVWAECYDPLINAIVHNIQAVLQSLAQRILTGAVMSDESLIAAVESVNQLQGLQRSRREQFSDIFLMASEANCLGGWPALRNGKGKTSLPWEEITGIEAETFRSMSQNELEAYWDCYWHGRDRLSVTCNTLVILTHQLQRLCADVDAESCDVQKIPST